MKRGFFLGVAIGAAGATYAYLAVMPIWRIK